jgi:hypothetical protein
VLSRIRTELESQQPREQAGFRRNFSTVDHIFTVRQIIENYTEYHKTLYLCFIDYSKAFDSISHQKLWIALKEQGINTKYINILKVIYENSKALVKLDQKGDKFKIQRGVRQGDPISPNLFNSLLEHVFRKFDWSQMGININGEYLNHLRFADDIVLLSENHKDLIYMIEKLNIHSQECGLDMNFEKTCAMTNGEEKNICIQNTNINYVPEYKYLGQIISLDGRYVDEVDRRIKKAWNAYWAHKYIFKSKLDIKLKKTAIDTVVTPTLLYGCQTWAITKNIIDRIQKFQRAVERSLLGVKIKDKLKNTCIRKMTNIVDAAEMFCRLKWRWAGHTARTNDDRWSEKILHWYPRGAERPRGRPRRRWRDDIVEEAGITWTRIANERELWSNMEEAYVQKWTNPTNLI